MILLDDHLVRDLAAGQLPQEVDALGDELATTNLWLFRLTSSLMREGLGGSLSGTVRGLGIDDLARFRRELTERFEVLTVVPLQEIVWSMAELQRHHADAGHRLSTIMVEALAAAHLLDAEIAVAAIDVGPGLRAAAEADNIAFRVVSN
jgi:hypothetical protein